MTGRGAIPLALALAACGSPEPASTPRPRAARVLGTATIGGDVVSTVDGYAISVAEVEQAARAAGVSRRTALARLEDEALLAQAAERAGHGEAREVWRAVRQAMVQALLEREIEAAPVEVEEAEVEEALERSRDRFEAPERRAAVDVVARVDRSPQAEDEAEAWIRRVHAQLAEAPDPTAAVLAFRRRPPEGLPFDVEVEEIDPIARDAAADEAYLRALFAVAEPGLLPDVVRSAIGWHAVVCTHIEPARQVPREEALATVRGELVAARRARALAELESELGRRIGVRVERENLRALEALRLAGPHP